MPVNRKTPFAPNIYSINESDKVMNMINRRRMTQAAKAQVDQVLYVPAALALHQRPGVPGIRSTFGTGTELLNSLRYDLGRTDRLGGGGAGLPA